MYYAEKPFGQRRQLKHVTGYFIRNVADDYLESTALDILKRLRLFFRKARVPGRTCVLQNILELYKNATITAAKSR